MLLDLFAGPVAGAVGAVGGVLRPAGELFDVGELARQVWLPALGPLLDAAGGAAGTVLGVLQPALEGLGAGGKEELALAVVRAALDQLPGGLAEAAESVVLRQSLAAVARELVGEEVLAVKVMLLVLAQLPGEEVGAQDLKALLLSAAALLDGGIRERVLKVVLYVAARLLGEEGGALTALLMAVSEQLGGEDQEQAGVSKVLWLVDAMLFGREKEETASALRPPAERHHDFSSQIASNRSRYLGDLISPDKDLQKKAGHVKRALEAIGGRAGLLVYDPGYGEGRGVAAWAVGNIETADFVAVVVPGMGSSLESFHEEAHRARSLYRQCREILGLTPEPRNETEADPVAVIAWQGYKAPRLHPEVASATLARQGGDRLREDLEQWRRYWRNSTARKTLDKPPSPQLTISALSYGSVVAGYAAAAGAAPDSLVLLGSPGTGRRAQHLNVPADQIFTAGTDTDIISMLDWFSIDPTHERYGDVTRMKAGYRWTGATDLLASYWKLTESWLGRNIRGAHTSYYDPGTESLANIARVTTGKPQEVTREEQRTRPLGGGYRTPLSRLVVEPPPTTEPANPQETFIDVRDLPWAITEKKTFDEGLKIGEGIVHARPYPGERISSSFDPASRLDLPEWVTLATTADGKTLQATCQPGRYGTTAAYDIKLTWHHKQYNLGIIPDDGQPHTINLHTQTHTTFHEIMQPGTGQTEILPLIPAKTTNEPESVTIPGRAGPGSPLTIHARLRIAVGSEIRKIVPDVRQRDVDTFLDSRVTVTYETGLRGSGYRGGGRNTTVLDGFALMLGEAERKESSGFWSPVNIDTAAFSGTINGKLKSAFDPTTDTGRENLRTVRTAVKPMVDQAAYLPAEVIRNIATYYKGILPQRLLKLAFMTPGVSDDVRNVAERWLSQPEGQRQVYALQLNISHDRSRLSTFGIMPMADLALTIGGSDPARESIIVPGVAVIADPTVALMISLDKDSDYAYRDNLAYTVTRGERASNKHARKYRFTVTYKIPTGLQNFIKEHLARFVAESLRYNDFTATGWAAARANAAGTAPVDESSLLRTEAIQWARQDASKIISRVPSSFENLSGEFGRRWTRDIDRLLFDPGEENRQRTLEKVASGLRTAAVIAAVASVVAGGAGAPALAAGLGGVSSLSALGATGTDLAIGLTTDQGEIARAAIDSFYSNIALDLLSLGMDAVAIAALKAARAAKTVAEGARQAGTAAHLSPTEVFETLSKWFDPDKLKKIPDKKIAATRFSQAAANGNPNVRMPQFIGTVGDTVLDDAQTTWMRTWGTSLSQHRMTTQIDAGLDAAGQKKFLSTLGDVELLPNDKCRDVLGDARTWANGNGFTDIRYGEMEFRMDPADPPTNHYFILAENGGVDYVIDVTRKQFPATSDLGAVTPLETYKDTWQQGSKTGIRETAVKIGRNLDEATVTKDGWFTDGTEIWTQAKWRNPQQPDIPPPGIRSGGALRGGDTGLNVSPREMRSSWAEAWPEVNRIDEGRNILGPSNGLAGKLYPKVVNGGKTGVDGFDVKVKEFKNSLLDPTQSASDARKKLVELYDMCKEIDPDTNLPRPGSKFPTATFNDALETVNAKRLWEAGDRTLHPWPYNLKAKKPDYVVGGTRPPSPIVGAGAEDAAKIFYEEARHVGDHFRMSGTMTMDEAAAKFSKDVRGKVQTYNEPVTVGGNVAGERNVRVVVDAHDLSIPGCPPYDTLKTRFTEVFQTSGASNSRLSRVDVILPDDTVLTLHTGTELRGGRRAMAPGGRRIPGVELSEFKEIKYGDEMPTNPCLFSDGNGSFWVGQLGKQPSEFFIPLADQPPLQFCSILSVEVRDIPIAERVQKAGSSGRYGFADLTPAKKEEAVRRLTNMNDIGMDSQLDYAQYAIAGKSKTLDDVTQSISSGSYPDGTFIWFGNDVHVMSAEVHAGKYVVYDSNTGKFAIQEKGAFLNTIRKQNVFVQTTQNSRQRRSTPEAWRWFVVAGPITVTTTTPGPSAPVVTMPAQNATVERKPVVSGTGTPGAQITVVKSHHLDTVLATVRVGQDRKWSAQVNQDLPPGQYVIATRQTVDGRDSLWADRTFTVKAPAPPAPVVEAPTQNATVGIRPVVSGTGTPGAQITVVKSHHLDTVLATVRVGQDRKWSAQVNQDLPPGTYSISSRETVDGQHSGWSANRPFTVQAPAPPVAVPSAPNIVLPEKNRTVGLRPTVSGWGTPGAQVTVVKSGHPETVLATTVVNSEGLWSAQLGLLNSGSHSVAARQSVGGKLSGWSENRAFTAVAPGGRGWGN
ncbi:alpha/beta hydrolase [Streptomyces olivoreticuli]